MHGGGRLNQSKDHGSTNNVVVALDDTEMDNENENNVSASGGPNGSGLVAAAAAAASSTGNYQAWYASADATSSATTASAAAAAAAASQEFEIDNSSIDLDTYVAGFTGLMRINRLLFVAEHCPSLRIDALRLALNFVAETYNVQLYNVIHKQLTDAFAKL